MGVKLKYKKIKRYNANGFTINLHVGNNIWNTIRVTYNAIKFDPNDIKPYFYEITKKGGLFRINDPFDLDLENIEDKNLTYFFGKLAFYIRNGDVYLSNKKIDTESFIDFILYIQKMFNKVLSFYPTKKELDRLTVVVEEARERGDKRLPPKIHKTGYFQQNGITCVLNGTDETIEKFGEPFYQKMIGDSEFSDFLPVPPSGLHVSLLGLEYARIQTEGRIVNIAVALKKEQKKLDHEFSSKNSFIPSLGHRTCLHMKPSSGQLMNLLRKHENRMKRTLKVYRKKPQNWHMTLGYFREGTSKHTQEMITRKINDYVRELLKKSGNLTFVQPAICTYEAHNKYDRLFESI